MIAGLLTLPCVVSSPGVPELDEFGDPVTDVMGTPLPVEPVRVETVCEVQQASTSEDRGDGLVDVQTWRVFLPAGTRVTASSTVEVRGMTLTLDGGPWTVRDPMLGVDSHIEATARLVQ